MNIKEKLSLWICHLQDQDSTGAWNKDDTKMFDECVQSLKLKELVKEAINTVIDLDTQILWKYLVEESEKW